MSLLASLPNVSVAVAGSGPLFGVWSTHASKSYRNMTVYDRSAAVTAFRQQEANLGQKGFLDAAGTASAQRTAQNLANPAAVDATVTFSGGPENGTVVVKCQGGMEKRFQVRLSGLGDQAIRQSFSDVDAAIAQCKAGRPMV